MAVLAVCYLLSIMPRIIHRPNTGLFQTKYFAHRGLHNYTQYPPENSMAAFERAVEEGFGMELDVQMTKDGVPVVFHDFKLKRICNAEGKVSQHTYEELQRYTLCDSGEKIPRFEDVLRMVDGRVPLIVEIKSERINVSDCACIDHLLRAYEGDYCIESFNPMVLFWFRIHHNSVVRGQLSSNFRRDEGYSNALYFFMQHLMLNFFAKPDFIAYNYRFRNEWGRKICHRLYRCPSAAWTIQSQKDLDAVRGDFDIFIFDGFYPNTNKSFS
jgi:glycerophosphoryl diester phosphodiesterase